MWLELILFIIVVAIYINYPRPEKSIAGKTVLITGGGSGIGKLMGIYFSKEGCKVVLWDINTKALEAVAQEIKTAGGIVHTYECDVSNREMIYSVAEQVKKDVGKVDILVNNAGIVVGNFFLDTRDDLTEKVLKINVLGVMWTTKVFLKQMLDDNSGYVVTIASAAATYGVPKLADYAASKWAVFGWAESLRLELRKLKKFGVGTTVVCPYYINTGMFDGVKSPNPLLPIQDQNYVAKAIIKAVKTDQKELYLPRFVMSAYLFRYTPIVIRDWVDENIMKLSNSMDDFHGQRRLQ